VTKVIFHPEARDELRAGVPFYRGESLRLGADFAAEVRSVVQRISEMPLAGSPSEAGTRRALLRRFPYTIVYSVKSDLVEILAVMHQRRKPQYWRRRMH